MTSSIKKELRRKIAQLICIEVRFPKLQKNPKIRLNLLNSVKKYQWGSVIFFEAEQKEAKKLITDLQKNSDIPLFVCSDLERGAGQHFNGLTNLPANMAIGATNNPEMAYLSGKITASEAKKIGVNVIFAPSVDVNSNPENPIINVRSFGENPEKVALMASEFIRACNDSGVITTAKHFPGHGDTAVDSHVALPIIDKTISELEKTELLPFREVIKKGVPGIMSAHIAVPALDNSLVPATMSKKIITDLLRKKMEFQGLVFTDALIMGGVKPGQIQQPEVVQALKAGCDILLMPPHPVKALKQIEKAVEEGIISLEIIERAYQRVQFYKKRFIDKKTDEKILKKNEGKIVAQEIAVNSVSKIRQTHSLPLKTAKQKIIHLVLDQDKNKAIWQNYAQKLLEYEVKTFTLTDGVSENRLERMTKIFSQADVIIVSFFSQIRAWKKNLYPEKKIIDWCQRNLRNKPVITIAFSNPYLLRKLPFLEDYYCTFSDSAESQQAITRILFEKFQLTGKSPVKIETD